nr:bifunctional 4-hydroxy-2-oxoglutarate aldolase/2-dehydro-3-deoxy-phosphogluconate aldolase [Treponemataceae bacterium]
MSDLLDRIRDTGIIPVIKLTSVEQAVPLAKALLDGGIPAAEVTFRSAAAADGIKAIKEAYPEMLLGAGTVINKDFAKRAIDAGAEFIVSPGFNPEVIDFVLDKGVPMIPGVATPGEIEQALCKGLDVLKFFPAEAAGGVAMLNAFAGPFSNVRFMATGGINAKNMGEYFK